MESINFNDFSVKERHEIITAFLIKMRKANSMHSAHSFFQYYLKQFYKIPSNLLDDIIYCQRALKNYLAVHQTITNVFAEQPDADPETKNNYLLEIEEVLHEINAECKYLLIRLEEDIYHFCLPFTEQQLQPNGNLINEMVSEAVVPLVCSSLLPFKPHSVAERPTESQLLRKYFTVSTEPKTKASLRTKDENPKPIKSAAPKKKPIPDADAAVTKAPAKQATKPAAPASEAASKTDAVNASRLHLQAALKRARLNKQVNCDAKPASPKESFLQSFGLCTQLEHKRMLLSRALNQKRNPRLTQN
ncbi:uncharacterized protein LOC115770176 [Drosophila novamexicana]|uniref:uncharacterized protein LOC115770176 n=1 Tax=Drosophila novamexicana TaxID=47314 RepID=UPI0011E5CD78|nr:uncharacterized protein LOC115770176 [Drosophila novamexicana]